jgi:putative oxidoreductase
MNALNRFADSVYCIVRLIVGLAYACHGGQKLFGYPGGGHGMSGLAFVAGIIEFFCGLLIGFGLFTRVAAFLASGEMAVAYFIFYVGAVPTLEAKFFPIMNGGELALVNCWIFFFMIFYGSGQWSIDALRHRLPDRYEITKFLWQLSASTDRTGSFLDQRITAGTKQLRLESSAHRRESSKPTCWKRQCDRARAKALCFKLPDLPRAIW